MRMGFLARCRCRIADRAGGWVWRERTLHQYALRVDSSRVVVAERFVHRICHLLPCRGGSLLRSGRALGWSGL